MEKGKRTEAEAAEITGRVRATTHLGELVDVDLVIESVVEDLAVKKDLFAELDSICKPETILATNTSTLPVVEMAMATGRPDLVCGIHFFNPAPAMALVEVVRPITAATPRWRRRSRSPPPAARTRSRSRTRPASSSTRSCSPT